MRFREGAKYLFIVICCHNWCLDHAVLNTYSGLQGMVTPEILANSKDGLSSHIHVVSLHSLPALLLAMNGLNDLLSSLPEVYVLYMICCTSELN